LKDFTTKEHSPPYPSSTDWQCCVFSGSQDGLVKTFEMLLNEGDSILVEDPTYSGALAALRPLGVEIVGVEVDHEGLNPHALETTLSQWHTTHPNRPLPKALYTIPTGQNPSGSTLSTERKKEIYAIAQKYNFIIIEDDPYWFLQFETSSATTSNTTDTEQRRSFLSFDIDGRVVRLDSFSKILSAGIRLGYATGPTSLLQRLEMHQQATNLHASGLSQMLVYKLLSKWGFDGLKRHVSQVQQFYKEQRDFMINAAVKHLTGLADWTRPSAGMFMWFRLHGIENTEVLIQEKARSAKVLLVPGKAFSPYNASSSYVRASFSLASEKDIDEALRRLSVLLKELRSFNAKSQ
jgi:kynurenine/2-aminoadipate aminotransferase